jgi:hypothetical protein
MKAASMALPFERPKLQATALMIDEKSFAAKLEACIKRSQPKLIEGEVIEAPDVSGE